MFVFVIQQGGVNGVISSPRRDNKIWVLLCFEEKEGKAEVKEEEQQRSGNKEGRLEKGKKGAGEMINPIKPLSVSSIGIVLRWLPLPQLRLWAAARLTHKLIPE